jgi:hypothetical protein
MHPPIWRPSPARIAASNLTRCAAFARAHHGAGAALDRGKRMLAARRFTGSPRNFAEYLTE